MGSLITTGVTVSNYTDSANRSLDSYQFCYTADEFIQLLGYTADELAILDQEWEKEEDRLNDADICGFGDDLGVREVLTKLPIDLPQEKVEALQESAERYRFNQRQALEREAEKKCANRATVEIFADMIKVKVPTRNTIKGGGERKECKGFSTSSRRRLIQRMAQWNLNGLFTSFFTLTYPAIYATNWKIWKRDIDVFFKRLERKYGDLVGLCWRLEQQKRGAPHFHMIVASKGAVCTCGTQEMREYKGKKRLVHKHTCLIHQFRKDVALMWADVVREGFRLSGGDMEKYQDEYLKHVKAGVNIESVNSRKQLMAYVSKYLAKVEMCESCKGKNVVDSVCKDCGCIQGKDTSIQGWGRIWGFRDLNGELDFDPIEIVEMDYEESVNLKRIVRKWMKSRGNVKYAQRVNGMVSYSVLGLGFQSDNNGLVKKIASGVRTGLFAAHISPQGVLDYGCGLGVSFSERLQMGLYDDLRGFSEGDEVNTPLGKATVSQVRYCDVLRRMRCVTYLDIPQGNGVRLAVFDLWQVKASGATEKVGQSSIW